MSRILPAIPIYILFLYSPANITFAQAPPSEAEIKKLMKMGEQMEKKLESDPQFKGLMQDEVPKNKVQAFPKQDKALWGLVHAGPMTVLETKNYLNKLHQILQPKFSGTAKQNADKIATLLKNDPKNIEAAAISSWYTGGKNEGLLLALNACIAKPEDMLYLNNLGALLNLDSKERLALPILKAIAANAPGNPMVLNNLGQAYTGLGELDSAMHYFGACLKISPDHPEANNTAGQIDQKKGNTKSAIDEFENSLKGGYNEGAANSLQIISIDSRLSDLIKPPGKLPYFNDNKYSLPRFCLNVSEADEVAQENEDFDNFIHSLVDVFSALASQENEMGTIDMAKMQKLILNNPGTVDLSNIRSPFENAYKIFLRLYLENLEKISVIGKIVERNNEEIKQILDEYHEKCTAASKSVEDQIRTIPCGEGNASGCDKIKELEKNLCANIDKMSNEVLVAVAGLQQNVEEKRLMIVREMFEDAAYYLCLSVPNRHMAAAEFYKAAENYLDQLLKIGSNRVLLYPSCPKESEVKSKPKSDNAEHFKCPINIELEYGIGKLKLNCEKFQFTIGEGARFNYEKNFETHQSTMSLGAGLGGDLGMFGVSAGADAEMGFYITFDGNNSISDAGIAYETSGYVSKGAMEIVGIITDQSSGAVEISSGYTIGINSGWTFH